jgi:hypothetical protein
MTTQLKLTKRQREVADMLRNGYDLYVLVNRSRNRKPRAFLVPSGQLFTHLIRSDEPSYVKEQEVSWTVIDALEKAHVIKPLRRSPQNEYVWIYALSESA